MHWLSIIGIGLAANLDNLGIGVSFGARKMKVPFVSNLIIAILSMIASYLSITVGHVVTYYMPSNLANWFGGLMIIFIGLWAIRSDILNRRSTAPKLKESANELTAILHDPVQADKDRNNILSWKESLTLGLALAINCLAGGFGAGITGLAPLPTTLAVGLFSLITVDLGIRAGQQLAKTWLGQWPNLAGGVILIAIGLYEIFI